MFNNDFMIGAATAAHQVEGNNKNSDFWAMEHMPYSNFKEPSLDAVDHYNRYEEDIKLMSDAGLNAYRFSIEWARIEPQEGKFNENEIKHYREVLKCCHENNITPIVTLHHFSSPKWLISKGGWESESTIEYFKRYTKYVVENLGELMKYICTINEANMGIQIRRVMEDMKKKMSNKSNDSNEANVQVGLNDDTNNFEEKMKKNYIAKGELFGVDPRNVNPFLAPKSENGDKIIMKCHTGAREIIKEINSDIKVGVTMSLYDYHILEGGEEIAKKLKEEDFIHYLPYIEEDDFFGVQNYSRKIIGPNGKVDPEGKMRKTDMGYEYYPEALGGVIRFVSKHFKKALIVTENGISTENDEDRVEFIQRALKGVKECIDEGINVKGYMYWSLLDNFEWQLGYAQKFGLISVDRKTQKRYPKKSLKFLGAIKEKSDLL